MSRFERIFDVACACCKADGANVPEAEAVIRLLVPQIRSAFAVIVTAITGRAQELLDGEHEAKDLALLLAAYVASAKRLGLRPLSATLVQHVEQAARALMVAAAEASGLPVPTETELRARAASAADLLQLQVEEVVADAVDRSEPAASRLAQAGPAPEGSPQSTPAPIDELAQALEAEQALRSLVDGWAYQTFNAGSVRAAAADGHNFIQLVAKIDDATTRFCRLVNGRVVPMARALAQLDRIDRAVASGDAEALVSAAPFITNPREATQEDVDLALERGGIAPFHHGCRTRNVPIRLDVG